MSALRTIKYPPEDPDAKIGPFLCETEASLQGDVVVTNIHRFYLAVVGIILSVMAICAVLLTVRW